MLWKVHLSAATLILMSTVGCEAGGRVAITLRKYQNRSHRKSNGRCCDYKLFGCSPCDAYFKLCVTDSSPSRDTCNLGQSVTNVVGRRDNHNHINIRKEFRFTSFRGVIRLYLEVWDKDVITRDDFVEGIHSTLQPVTPGKRPFKKSLTLTGRRISVALDVEVSCDPYYHGNSCSVWCKPRDDSSGHYTCDDQGQKVCRREWYGSSCTRRCVPWDDPANGHFFCDKEGNTRCLRHWQSPDCKSCEKNWFGLKCATYCVPQDSDALGHYICSRKDGKKECMPGWFGNECCTHCEPHDDHVGHYSCAHDGSKQCMTGWHGQNCTTFCIPSDDEELGRFTCDEEGNKVCLDGYKPPECDECLPDSFGANCSLTCVTVTQQQGHFDCTDDGVKKCQLWWYGPECAQYCVPHDDSEHGHYTCDERDGSKVCREGWDGASCRQPRQD